MNEKITFRITDEFRNELLKVHEYMREEGLDLDDSKVIRYLLTKGLEKMRLEGKLRD